jgi:anti-anti-sigma factor
MEIREQRHGAVTVLKPIGPLLQADAGDFARLVSRALARSLGRFVLDASAMPFVDSAGLESLVAAADELAQNGQLLRLCTVGETLREVLELTELATRFEYFDDVTDATRSFL